MNNQTETISRRKFIKAALFAGASALTGYGLSQSPTNVRYLPDELSASDQLNATATAVARRGETTSFHEEGGYSQEIFEQIRRSAFAVELRGDKAIAIGTAWLAGNNNGRLQFVTNRHLYSGAGKSVYDIRLWRPSLDNYPLATNQFNIVTTEQGLDIAVINCNAINFADELQPLAWKEQRIPKLGSRTLIVGYPANLRRVEGIILLMVRY